MLLKVSLNKMKSIINLKNDGFNSRAGAYAIHKAIVTKGTGVEIVIA